MSFYIILTIKIPYFPKRYSHLILCDVWNASLYKNFHYFLNLKSKANAFSRPDDVIRRPRLWSHTLYYVSLVVNPRQKDRVFITE